MTTITKITISCPDDTMGDTSPEDCDAYRVWFAAQLSAQYPDATIVVTETDERPQIETDDNSDDADLAKGLHEFDNRCWDSCPWDFRNPMAHENHPNRNWRQRLNHAADQWITTTEGQLLSELPLGPGALAKRLRLAYLAGLRDGEGRKIDLISLDKSNRDER